MSKRRRHVPCVQQEPDRSVQLVEAQRKIRSHVVSAGDSLVIRRAYLERFDDRFRMLSVALRK